MKSILTLLSAICVSVVSVQVLGAELTPIDRIRRIGKLEVLSGRMQIAHYGKDSFRFGSVSAAYLGEATYKIAIDFSKATCTDDCIELPRPSFWCEIDEGKTRMYRDKPWTSGVMVTAEDKKEFANKQLAFIDSKAQRAVGEESELMRQAENQVERIARAYFHAWGNTNVVMKVIFKKEDK